MNKPKCCWDCKYFEHSERLGQNWDYCFAEDKSLFDECIDPHDEIASFCPEPWNWEEE